MYTFEAGRDYRADTQSGYPVLRCAKRTKCYFFSNNGARHLIRFSEALGREYITLGSRRIYAN